MISGIYKNYEDIIQEINQINLYVSDEDIMLFKERDPNFDNFYSLMKKCILLHTKGNTIPRQVVEQISKEYSSFFGYDRDSARFARRVCEHILYEEGVKTRDSSVVIEEGILDQLSNLLPVVEPEFLQKIVSKTERRRIWKGLFNEFLRRTPEEDKITLKNAKEFLIEKNFHPDFINLYYKQFLKNKKLTEKAAESITGNVAKVLIDEFFKLIATETLLRGGLKAVAKSTYNIQNDPYIGTITGKTKKRTVSGQQTAQQQTTQSQSPQQQSKQQSQQSAQQTASSPKEEIKKLIKAKADTETDLAKKQQYEKMLKAIDLLF